TVCGERAFGGRGSVGEDRRQPDGAVAVFVKAPRVGVQRFRWERFAAFGYHGSARGVLGQERAVVGEVGDAEVGRAADDSRKCCHFSGHGNGFCDLGTPEPRRHPRADSVEEDIGRLVCEFRPRVGDVVGGVLCGVDEEQPAQVFRHHHWLSQAADLRACQGSRARERRRPTGRFSARNQLGGVLTPHGFAERPGRLVEESFAGGRGTRNQGKRHAIPPVAGPAYGLRGVAGFVLRRDLLGGARVRERSLPEPSFDRFRSHRGLPDRRRWRDGPHRRQQSKADNRGGKDSSVWAHSIPHSLSARPAGGSIWSQRQALGSPAAPIPRLFHFDAYFFRFCGIDTFGALRAFVGGFFAFCGADALQVAFVSDFRDFVYHFDRGRYRREVDVFDFTEFLRAYLHGT